MWSTPNLIVASTYTKNMVHGASHRQLKCTPAEGKTWFAATWGLHAGSTSRAPYSVSASWRDHMLILPGNSLMWQNVCRPQMWLLLWQLMRWHCWQSVHQKSQNLQRSCLLSSKHTLWIAISCLFSPQKGWANGCAMITEKEVFDEGKLLCHGSVRRWPLNVMFGRRGSWVFCASQEMTLPACSHRLHGILWVRRIIIVLRSHKFQIFSVVSINRGGGHFSCS